MGKTYLSFELVEEKPKTNVYDVMNVQTDESLGSVHWYSPWRQYCFFCFIDLVLSKSCMDQICKFIENLMKEREKKT